MTALAPDGRAVIEPALCREPNPIEASLLPAWIKERAAAFDRPIGADEASAEPSEFLTIEEFAAVFRVTPRTVSRWLADRRIFCIRVGRSVRIPRSELTRLPTAHMSLKD
jgi:excisionase family DNA binding protein